MSSANIARYLFTESGMAALRDFVDNGTLFAFDLDGTLAPIIDNPKNVQIPEPIMKELTLLNFLAPLAIITGRSKADAQLRLGISPGYLIGNHGAEGLPGWKASEKQYRHLGNIWEKQLNAMLPVTDNQGIVLENKGSTLSIHYRNVLDKEKARDMLLRAIGLLAPRPKHVSGKYVENLIPAAAPDKGTAVLHLLRQSGCQKAVFAGDDETDEDVFKIAGDNLFTVHVGNGEKTRARYFLCDQREIEMFLRKINSSLESMATTNTERHGQV